MKVKEQYHTVVLYTFYLLQYLFHNLQEDKLLCGHYFQAKSITCVIFIGIPE